MFQLHMFRRAYKHFFRRFSTRHVIATGNNVAAVQHLRHKEPPAIKFCGHWVSRLEGFGVSDSEENLKYPRIQYRCACLRVKASRLPTSCKPLRPPPLPVTPTTITCVTVTFATRALCSGGLFVALSSKPFILSKSKLACRCRNLASAVFC